ncbi:MAG: fasciclin domain-containing protein [Gammaproteobacteria bacterium]
MKSLIAASGLALIVAGTACAGGMSNDKSMSKGMSDSMTAHGMVMVGGSAMSPAKNIVQNAVNSKDHTTLVALVKEAGLVSALESKGPFTVFAPTNQAFSELPASTVKALQEPKNRAQLKSILLYHVVSGRYDFNRLAGLIKQGGGKAMLKTLNGMDLTFMMNGSHNIVVKDAKGGIAQISTYNVYQSNGVIQVVNHVLLP